VQAVGSAAYTDLQIAETVHAVNGVLQQVNGEAHRQPPWELLTAAERERVLSLVRQFRFGAIPRQVHERWCEAMAEAGWSYGEVWSAEARTHPNLVPFEELGYRQRVKDRMAQQVVMVMALGQAW
jgi:hypothetical protein